MSHFMDKDDAEFIRETSDLALDLMSEYNVIPSPVNYQIWYAYAGKTDMSLVQNMENMIDKGITFSNNICSNLHQKYFSDESLQDTITEAGDGFQKHLAKLAKTIQSASDGTASYNGALSDHLGNLEEIEGGAALKDIIGGLLQDTQKMEALNQEMEKELKASTLEVQKLQSTLNAAQHENVTDLLTNIGNRKCFEASLKKAITVAQETEEEFCLLFADIDHFKKFNDTWGHHVGDQVLKAVAHAFKTRIGQKGTPSRYGGEEFVLVLPKTDLNKAFILADSLRSTINQRTMKRKSTGETIGKVSISIGIAQFRTGDSRDSLLKRADSALYLAKNSGRNVVKTENHLGEKKEDVA